MHRLTSGLLMLSLACFAAEARRLHGRNWGPDEHGDAGGTQVLNNARNLRPGTSGVKALTPEAAEAIANPNFNGLWRRANPPGATLTYATVEGDPVTVNPNRNKKAVQPRARSAQDIQFRPQPNLASGAAQVPTVTMGNAAYASTYEGALSVAASDAITVNGKVNGMNTVKATNMLTPYTQPLRRASKRASWGATAQTAGSVAVTGTGDGNMAVANANEVSAIAMTAKTGFDAWQSDPRDTGVGRGTST